MMLYLTGAQASLIKSQYNPQTDVNKSLGGYVSSSPVPNNALNVLFDLLSSYTLEKKQSETIAIALINQFDYPVENVELKIIPDINNVSMFKVAAVNVGKDFAMEQIANRYQEPINATFFDATFCRAAVELEIITPATAGEQIALYPFNVVIDVIEGGIEGTWQAFEVAFADNNDYTVKRLTENHFYIQRRDEAVVESLECSYVATETFTANFLGKFENKINNTVLLKQVMQPQETIGIWIQRQIKNNVYDKNEELIKQYVEKQVKPNIEQIELVISYNLLELNNYDNTEYEAESYS